MFCAKRSTSRMPHTSLTAPRSCPVTKALHEVSGRFQVCMMVSPSTPASASVFSISVNCGQARHGRLRSVGRVAPRSLRRAARRWWAGAGARRRTQAHAGARRRTQAHAGVRRRAQAGDSRSIDRSKAARLLAREGRREREGRARRAKCRHVLLQLQHRVHVFFARQLFFPN